MAKAVIVLYGRDRSGRALLGVSTLLLLFCWATRVAGQPLAQVTEESVKAAYLYRFADYVRWPDGRSERASIPVTIAVLGDATVADELRAITANRSVRGRPVGVQELAAGDSLEGIHILFVAADSMGDLPRLREAAQIQSTLLVTESPGALELGSVINFTPVDRRVRFEVSLDSAERSKIRLNSQLLTVAERVERGRN